MQDVTTLGFMQVIGRYGPPDYLVTEYFRVHQHSRLETHIVESILEHGTGRPVFAQIIGEDLSAIGRTIESLAKLPIAGIDLNLGCPAPKVYKKNVGGGLLRDPARVAEIFRFMRAHIGSCFTVKMRIGFCDADPFDSIVEAAAEHGVEMLTVHARTVEDSYRGSVKPEYIADAASRLDCPVLGNGGITSPRSALAMVRQTGAAGVMIGRAAIRNPWIFRQIRELAGGQEIFHPTLADVRQYVDDLLAIHVLPEQPELKNLGRMKKFLNFVSLGVDPEAAFQYQMRRCRTLKNLLEVCDAFMVAGRKGGQAFSLEPYSGLVARPNCEASANEKPKPANASLATAAW
jgi:tRNA-dihydrouridine synthase